MCADKPFPAPTCSGISVAVSSSPLTPRPPWDCALVTGLDEGLTTDESDVEAAPERQCRASSRSRSRLGRSAFHDAYAQWMNVRLTPGRPWHGSLLVFSSRSDLTHGLRSCGMDADGLGSLVTWLQAQAGARPGCVAHSVLKLISSHKLDDLEALIDSNPAALDARDDHGNTLLMLVARAGFRKVCVFTSQQSNKFTLLSIHTLSH